ncbi:hypothetical protein MCUN1_000089 [Malassezia cuniculi]|uniref:Glutathione-specific gamma-glutamylcyclotransferase n=1 Tax=Malassezia cuniculi TaxID=948313 RepID=A0AAF0EMY2_9BASI|nr:hypothetical protein MCUN1_000089 [Malassezia cuniculi]
MGAQQSSEAPVSDDAFVDYYQLLEVEQTASSDEIRKSYRKLALKYHPDKNPDNVAEANRKFTRILEAYEVLSDDAERAWYDRNRDQLINGDAEEEDEDIDAKFRFFKSGGAAPKASSSAAGIGVPHLLRFFNPSLAKDLSDSDTSFYGTFRRLFERIAEEDRVAAPYPGESHENEFASSDRDDAHWYPSFGHPNTPYTADGPNVRDFYQFWTNFSSRKSFAWKDVADLRQAQDRRVKRLMEKDNKRSRTNARREYNEAIRSLAAFIRKRDPRFKAYQAAQNSARSAEEQAEIERRRKELSDARQEAKRAQAASFQAQSWQVTEEKDEFDDFTSGESDIDVDELGDEPFWDCVACDKIFQSQAAWENHERSKKHKKEVARLKREMQSQDALLADASGVDDDNTAADAVVDADQLADAAADLSLDSDDAAETTTGSRKKSKKQKKRAKKMVAALEEDQQAPAPVSSALAEKLPHLAELPILTERPEGSFDVFGYGSLIFKPPPHVIGYTPGFIKGFARRFAQHSEDHRGTPERPGRVVTLVTAEHWHKLESANETLDDDIVWGISYTVDPAHATEVREYLDHREKNGYSPLWEPIWGMTGPKWHKQETVLVEKALVYVGLPDNEAFVGPQPLDELAERIYTCEGPSGRNDEYLLRLAEAVRLLTPDSNDHYLFTLEKMVLALKKNGNKKPKARRAPAENTAVGREKCTVCGARFESRSKLFAHVREKDHARAPDSRKGKK